MPNTLTQTQINEFSEKGYLRVSAAFSPTDASQMYAFVWNEFRAKFGILESAPLTWSLDWAVKQLSKNDRVFDAMSSARLCGAIDDLLGVGHWSIPKNWGAFLISFPSTAPWTTPSIGWHFDGDPKQNLSGLGGLRVFTYISRVEAMGGGTLAIERSHEMARVFFSKLPATELQKPRAELRKRFIAAHPELLALTSGAPMLDDYRTKVVELKGEPGDAVICHPLLLHAKSDNCGKSPRFVRVISL